MKPLLPWINKKPLWLKGGIYGVLICVFLLAFYLVFFKVVFTLADPPSMLMLPPIITGHVFLPMVVYHFDTSVPLVKFLVGVGCMILLSSVYFILGALMGLIFERRHSRKLKS